MADVDDKISSWCSQRQERSSTLAIDNYHTLAKLWTSLIPIIIKWLNDILHSGIIHSPQTYTSGRSTWNVQSAAVNCAWTEMIISVITRVILPWCTRNKEVLGERVLRVEGWYGFLNQSRYIRTITPNNIRRKPDSKTHWKVSHPNMRSMPRKQCMIERIDSSTTPWSLSAINNIPLAEKLS